MGGGTVAGRQNRKGSKEEESQNLRLVAEKRDGLEVVNNSACSEVNAVRDGSLSTGLWIVP